MTNISPDTFLKHPAVPLDNVVTEHHPIGRCVRGEHQRVVASSGRLSIGGLGQMRAASLRPIEIADADVHNDDDIGRSCVAVARRGPSAIQMRPILFRLGGSARV